MGTCGVKGGGGAQVGAKGAAAPPGGAAAPPGGAAAVRKTVSARTLAATGGIPDTPTAPCKYAAALKEAGQEHVLARWGGLGEEQRASLERQIADIDGRIGLSAVRTTLADTLKANEALQKGGGAIAPAPAEWVGLCDASDPAAEERWEKVGLDEVAAGRCATCVLAGGMGTRLGYSFPKGMLGDRDSGRPEFTASGKSLFQLQAERIHKVQRMAQAHAGAAEQPTVWWLVMTGPATHVMITGFFEKHGYWGLRSEQVIFFEQGVMPCISEDGKMLMATAHEISTSPDGNAGIYPALRRGGVLEKLRKEGVAWVQSYSVDNILTRVADPVWYGFMKDQGADVCAKTIPKARWDEAVGVVTLRDGKAGVIEYSEIGETRAQEKDASGALLYNAANICLQAYSLDFLAGPAQDYATKTPLWHIAKKQIDTVDGKVPGVKLEGFIFDCFAVTRNFRMLQVDRAVEFSAIKNPSGSGKADTPDTALASLARLHRKWLRAAGAELPPDAPDGSGPIVEISPLVSYRGEGLAQHTERAAGPAPIVISE